MVTFPIHEPFPNGTYLSIRQLSIYKKYVKSQGKKTEQLE